MSIIKGHVNYASWYVIPWVIKLARSFKKCKCPRCQGLLNIVLDEWQRKNGIFVGYCYNPKHRRLKVKVVPNIRMENNSKPDEPYSMAELSCIFCGNKKMWFQKGRSYVAGNRMVYECQNCKIGLEHQGKIVKDCLPYEEIIMVKILPYKYN